MTGFDAAIFDAAIFDMDGLLVDSEPVWREVEIAVFGRHGVALTEESCVQTKGMFLPDVARYWYARCPWEGPGPDEVAAEIVDAMEVRLSQEATFTHGAPHALDFCQQRGMRLALASSSPRRLIDAVVGRLRLGDRFAVIHSAEDEPAGKPDPGIFRTTAQLLDVAPARCVVFEDAPAGVMAAKAAGMTCVAVPEAHDVTGGGAGGSDAGLGGADVVLGSLADLDDAVLSGLVLPGHDAGHAPPPPRRRRISGRYSGK